MSETLAGGVIRYWKLWLVVWVLLAVAASGIVNGWVNSVGLVSSEIPTWHEVVSDGESVRLPSNAPSQRAEQLFRSAFPDERLASSAVLILHRDGSALTSQDRTFIEDALTPALTALQTGSSSTIDRVRDFNDRYIGQILDQQNGEATLIVADLKYDFLDRRNQTTIDQIQHLIAPGGGLLRSKVPDGLQISLGGSATVGRDLLVAVEQDVAQFQWWPMLIVLGVSLVLFRAPLLALIPLAVVFTSLELSLATLSLLAWAGASGFELLATLRPFSGLRTFVSIIVYGAGLNYSIFLIARYRAQLSHGDQPESSLEQALVQSRGSVFASLGTIGCGVGTMLIASFEKYQQVGGAMALALGITLICASTLVPALLRLTGRRVFWPHAYDSHPNVSVQLLPMSHSRKQLQHSVAAANWQPVFRHPALVWTFCLAILAPFAWIGFTYHNQTSFEVLADLPASAPGVVGSRTIEKYFGAGQCGPITVLFSNPEVDFSDNETFESVYTLIAGLTDKQQDLGIENIRSMIHPLGLDIPTGIFARGIAKRHYVSTSDELSGHVMRLDLLTAEDALSPASRERLRLIRTHLRESLPAAIREGTEISFLGTTASVIDLKHVTDRDQLILDIAFFGLMLMALFCLFRKSAIPCYQMCSVAFMYFVALGATTVIFWNLDPNFAGLDWKVPLFLFTILVVVGQDYNVFIATQLYETGLLDGQPARMRTALHAAGRTITHCGVLTAVAFVALAFLGQLGSSRQLGVALVLGILLDTVISRRLLFPAWLMMTSSKVVGVRMKNPIRLTAARLRELSGSRIVL